MRYALPAIIIIAAFLIPAGCSRPEILPDEQPKLAPGINFNPEYDFKDHVTFYRPGSLPAGGTMGKYVDVRYPDDKYPPVNPWRNLTDVPKVRSPYEYREMEFEKDGEVDTTDISGPDVSGRPYDKETLDSTKRAREAQNK
jgi:hypothetical protein